MAVAAAVLPDRSSIVKVSAAGRAAAILRPAPASSQQQAVRAKAPAASQLDLLYLSDLETGRKGSHSWHSRPVLFFWIMYKIDIFHAVRAKILMSFFCMNM